MPANTQLLHAMQEVNGHVYALADRMRKLN